jgi:isoleucyl-tRNA synthetase
MARQDFEHSYPHCWRCHNPVIFRATEQWFIGMETPMEGTTFRQRALAEIKRVKWDPAWGEERISNMIATRPDWCISRQRIWGVPIAVFLCTKCERPLKSHEVNLRVVEMFEREGADSWYIRAPNEILPAGIKCETPGCDGSEFTKEMDILDVWFESGTSWAAVLEAEPELCFPADLYTEGGDQHRGWFHSSLLTAVALRDQAPYKMVATSGWTLDEQGRPMSKSLGNVVDPVDIAKRLGGEIVRLWVASVDFREDVAASENLMQRVASNYRDMRNTLRYLLMNLDGFSPVEDTVAFDDLLPFDKYILARAAEVTTKVRGWYDTFEFHRVYQALNEFSTVDLSATYLDLIKDRLYIFAPKSQGRRSAQTALWHLVEMLVRLVAPILSFTADEVWGYLPKVAGRESSVHIAHFPTAEELFPSDAAAYLSDWIQLLGLRNEVLLTLEALRKEKIIGKALDAKVEIEAPAAMQPLLARYNDSLKELLNVSQVSWTTSPNADGIRVAASPADGTKCERCWNYSIHVGEDPRWPTVCERCSAALSEMGVEALA